MASEVILPRLGQGMEVGTIVRWLKSEGDKVEKGEPLFELDTDKVTQEVEAEASGVLLKIVVPEGEVPVGTAIAYVGETGEEVPQGTGTQPEEEESPPEQVPVPTERADGSGRDGGIEADAVGLREEPRDDPLGRSSGHGQRAPRPPRGVDGRVDQPTPDLGAVELSRALGGDLGGEGGRDRVERRETFDRPQPPFEPAAVDRREDGRRAAPVVDGADLGDGRGCRHDAWPTGGHPVRATRASRRRHEQGEDETLRHDPAVCNSRAAKIRAPRDGGGPGSHRRR